MPNDAEQNKYTRPLSFFWCRDHKQRDYSFNEYIGLIESFHGYVAPGLLIGGKMVDMAIKHIPEGTLFDAVCETTNCLPDAIQLLTPCTVGNGWMKVLSLGRFSLIFYDKYEGKGVRVFLDPAKLEPWPEIKAWFFQLKSKADQDFEQLLESIGTAGEEILSLHKVQIKPRFMETHRLGKKALCPLCGEAYPIKYGTICSGCQGDAPYFSDKMPNDQKKRKPLSLTSVPIDQAVGQLVLHDMTKIIPGKEKGPAFKKGHVISAGDLCRLQQMGRRSVYIDDHKAHDPDWMHENEPALLFAEKMAGDGVSFTEPPSEGKVNFKADRDGMLVVAEKWLEAFNMTQGVMCASRKNYSLVIKGNDLAGTRVIPLFFPKSDFKRAMRILENGPLFRVLPLRKAKVGILVTGTEVFRGLIQDDFIPIISSKAQKLGCEVIHSLIVPDDRKAIRRGINDIIDRGADLLVTTAGLSVDPDDVTREGIVDAGATDIIYGVPILPGAMTLLARIGDIRVIGVPACALYYKRTSFDLLLPRILAGLSVTRADFAKMGHGAFCLGCKTCSFPKCSFGK